MGILMILIDINSNTHEQLIFSSVLYPTIHDMLDESGEISLRPHVAMAIENDV